MKLVFYISFLFLSTLLKAQLTQPCINPAMVEPYYMCNDPFYNPVCGCDNITYRNQCNAFHVHGVTSWRSGVCSGLDVDMFPNPVLSSEPLTVNLSYPENVTGNVDVKISDMYGKIWDHRMINNFNRMMIQFDMSIYPTGVYLLIVQSNQKSGTVRKFSKN